MNSNLKEIEQKLYNYFNREKRLKTLNKRLELLKSQIAEIEYKLQHIDYTLPEESMSIGWGERVQSSKTGQSFAERSLDKITYRLQENERRKQHEVLSIEENINQLIDDNLIIEDGIKDLNDWCIKLLKEKCKYKKTDWQIAQNMNMAQSTVTRKKNELLENIDSWFRLTKNMH